MSGQISEMWKLISAQAEYSFNLGHSTAYGLTSYVTAWLKLYHLAEFMTALLISEIGDYSQTTKYIDECRRIGIKVSPPDINKSDTIYTIHDNSILFGLQSIKGVGEKAANVIKEERKESPFQSFDDFYNRMKSNGLINTSTTIALIKSGAFGSNKEELLYKFADLTSAKRTFSPVVTLPARKELLSLGIVQDEELLKNKSFCLEKWNEYKKKKFDEEQNSKSKKHLDEFQTKYMQNPDMWEFETLSIFLTDNPLKKVEEYIIPFSNTDDGGLCVLFGTISNIKRKKQKNGKTYAYIELLTNDGLIEGTVFNQQYTEHQDIIKKGNNVVIISEKNGGQFSAKNLMELSKWIEIVKQTNIDSLPPHKRIIFDIQMFGKSNIVFPDVHKCFHVVLSINVNKNGTARLELYSLVDGSIKPIKIKKKKYETCNLEIGWVIRTLRTDWDGKWRNQGRDSSGKEIFSQIEEKEEWLTQYDVVRT